MAKLDEFSKTWVLIFCYILLINAEIWLNWENIDYWRSLETILNLEKKEFLNKFQNEMSKLGKKKIK